MEAEFKELLISIQGGLSAIKDQQAAIVAMQGQIERLQQDSKIFMAVIYGNDRDGHAGLLVEVDRLKQARHFMQGIGHTIAGVVGAVAAVLVEKLWAVK